MSLALIQLIVAASIDAIWGEPPSRFHPVVLMGRWANALKARLFSETTEMSTNRSPWTGIFVTVAVVLPSAWVGEIVETLPTVLSFEPAFFQPAVCRCACWPRRGCAWRQLERGETNQARRDLGHLYAEQPPNSGSADLSAGAIESVAENTTDSVVAPVFYFVLFGLPGALAYRAVNTLDAMFGYRGYEWFGKFVAKLDDVLNFVPARLAALLILAAGKLLGLRVKDAIATWKSDAGRTESPNAG